MTFNLYFNDERPRMAIFVSKMSHCLYDLLARYKAGEWNVDIPCIVSNHEDLRYVAEQFNIPYYVWSIKKDHSNKEEVEKAEMELLKKEKVTFIVLAHDKRLPTQDYQHPPFIPTSLHWCKTLSSGMGKRCEDYRRHKPLCNSRLGCRSYYRARCHPHHPQGHS